MRELEEKEIFYASLESVVGQLIILGDLNGQRKLVTSYMLNTIDVAPEIYKVNSF